MRNWNGFSSDDGVYEDEVCVGDTPMMFESLVESQIAELLFKIDMYCLDREKDPIRRHNLYIKIIKRMKEGTI